MQATNRMPDNKTSEVTKNWSATLGTTIALLMIVAAYYPTLTEDFAPQDQWRAFKYSLEPGLPGERYNACFDTTIKFYFLTGRWLIWVGECFEHSAVAQIKDFAPLRIIVLAVVLLSAITFRNVLENIVNSASVATLLATMIVLLPGYAFMYYQGLTGMPVLLALLLSLLSFRFTSRAFTEGREKNFYSDLGIGGILFLSACFIYPIFAFAIIPTAFIFSAFRPDSPLLKRVYLCARLCLFYAAAALIYYLMVKTGIAIAEYYGKSIPDLKDYQMAITTEPDALINKFLIIFHELTDMPLASFFHLPAWISLPILIGPAGIMFYQGKRLGWGKSGSILAAVVYLLSVPVILVVSVSPWLLSHLSGNAYRYMLPIHFLLILSFGILIAGGIKKLNGIYGELIAHRVESSILVALVSIFSINQISLSQQQIFDSTIEINHMRAVYNEMITSGKFWNLKEIHIIRPEIGRHYNGRPIDREFAPATMANPEHIIQMTHAVLRDTLPLNQLKRIPLVDCRFDRKCANSTSENGLVISQSNYGTPLPNLRNNHVIINFSNLNKKLRLIKDIEIDVDSPIAASSQHENYSPKYILGTGPHIWHAESPPQYPQWVQFKFSPPERYSVLSIKAQSNGQLAFLERAPKHFIFQGSNDAKIWTDLIEIKDAGFTSEKPWRTFEFKNDKEYTFYRIYVKANGGEKSFLTIEQVALN